MFTVGVAGKFPVYLVQTDGITPATAEAGGQPQISLNGSAWTNTAATLTAVGNGHYVCDLTVSELSATGVVTLRYKSVNTAEFDLSLPVRGYYNFQQQPLVRIKQNESTANNLRVYVTFKTTAGLPQTGMTSQTLNYLKPGASPTPGSVSVSLTEVNSTFSPGLYYFSIPTSSPNLVDVKGTGHLMFWNSVGVYDAVVIPYEVVGVDQYDGVRGGITALPNAAAEAAGGLYTRGSGTGQINQSAPGSADVNAASIGSSAISAGSFASSAITAAAIASGAITSAKFGSGAITSTVLATDCIGSAQLAASGITEIQSGLATSAALNIVDDFIDTEIATLMTSVAAIKAVTDTLGLPAIADAVLDEVVEGAHTVREYLRGYASALFGKVTYSGTSRVFRDVDDTKDRITATVDASGRLIGGLVLT